MTRMRLQNFACLVSLAVASGCGQTEPPPSSGFSQADLTGAWDRIWFTTNDAAGWAFHSLTVDASGQVTFNGCLNQSGPCTVTATVAFGIDASGNVTATGTGSSPTLHGTMNAAKNLIFATASVPSTGTPSGYSIQVFRKRVPGVTWTSADVANLAFAYHSLHSGPNAGWERGAGTTDGTGSLTVTSSLTSAGSSQTPPPGFATVQIDAQGLVTLAGPGAPSFQGVMTSDKKTIFGVLTTTVGPPASYGFMALLATGQQTFAQADLATTWNFRALTSGLAVATSSWMRGTIQIDAAGAVTFLSATNQNGPTTVNGFSIQLGPTGGISRADLASYAGQMSFHKDFFVRTQTLSGADSLSIAAR